MYLTEPGFYIGAGDLKSDPQPYATLYSLGHFPRPSFLNSFGQVSDDSHDYEF